MCTDFENPDRKAPALPAVVLSPGYFCCIFSPGLCCFLQQETPPEWSECEEGLGRWALGSLLTEKPSIAHFEKLLALGFVWS